MKEVIVETKKENENVTSLYRRFLKRFRSAGIQTHTKRNRFQERKMSKMVRRKDCISRLTQRAKFVRLERLGKIAPRSTYKK